MGLLTFVRHKMVSYERKQNTQKSTKQNKNNIKTWIIFTSSLTSPVSAESGASIKLDSVTDPSRTESSSSIARGSSFSSSSWRVLINCFWKFCKEMILNVSTSKKQTFFCGWKKKLLKETVLKVVFFLIMGSLNLLQPVKYCQIKWFKIVGIFCYKVIVFNT